MFTYRFFPVPFLLYIGNKEIMTRKKLKALLCLLPMFIFICAALYGIIHLLIIDHIFRDIVAFIVKVLCSMGILVLVVWLTIKGFTMLEEIKNDRETFADKL